MLKQGRTARDKEQVCESQSLESIMRRSGYALAPVCRFQRCSTSSRKARNSG